MLAGSKSSHEILVISQNFQAYCQSMVPEVQVVAPAVETSEG